MGQQQDCSVGAAAPGQSIALCQAKAVAPQPVAVLADGPRTQDVRKRGLQLPRSQPSRFGEMSWLAVGLLLELGCSWKQHVRAEGVAGHVECWRALNH